MEDRRSLWLLLPKPVRALPADLAGILVVTTLVNIAVFTPAVRETPLRIPLGLVFVLFVPGYVFIAALFPEAGTSPATDPSTDADATTERLPESGTLSRNGIDGIERVALAFGLSIAIVPLIGLVLNFTPWGIRLGPIMITTTGFTLATAGVAAVRRWDLPEDERFRVPYREWYRTGRSELLEPESRTDGLLNVLLVCSIVLALGSVTFAVVVPPQGEQFSAVYLLTEDDDGELVADNYPTEFTPGTSEELIVGVDNHEHQQTEYTVVVLEQQTTAAPTETGVGNESTTNETVVTDQRELDRFQATLEHNESWHHSHEIQPTFSGDDVRITWLLFPGTNVPESPSTEETEYHVHLWVDVSEDID